MNQVGSSGRSFDRGSGQEHTERTGASETALWVASRDFVLRCCGEKQSGILVEHPERVCNTRQPASFRRVSCNGEPEMRCLERKHSAGMIDKLDVRVPGMTPL